MKQVVLLAVLFVLPLTLCAQNRTAGSALPQRQAALALEQQGRNAEAETAWRALAKAHPQSPEPYAHLGLLAARQQRYKDAVDLYRKALKLGPAPASLRLNLGLALFKDGQLKQAAAEFERLLPAQPANLQINTLAGMSHYGLGEYKEAIPFFQTATGLDKQNLPLRLALAHSCLWSKQTQCVMDTYREILDLNAESAEADMIAGEALDEMKDNEGSTKMFRAAVKANPKEPNVHFGLGYLLWTQKQYTEAAQEFQAELANDPDHVQSMLYLADARIQMNQFEDARALLARVVVLNPKIPLGHLDLGIVYAEAGRKEDAIRELSLAEKMMPSGGEVTVEMVTVHWRLARLYREMGRKEEAKAEFDKASQLNKQADVDLHNKIANGHPRPPEAQTPSTTPTDGDSSIKPSALVP